MAKPDAAREPRSGDVVVIESDYEISSSESPMATLDLADFPDVVDLPDDDNDNEDVLLPDGDNNDDDTLKHKSLENVRGAPVQRPRLDKVKAKKGKKAATAHRTAAKKGKTSATAHRIAAKKGKQSSIEHRVASDACRQKTEAPWVADRLSRSGDWTLQGWPGRLLRVTARQTV